MSKHTENSSNYILPADPGALIRPSEAAKYLGVGKSTLWRWIADGKIERPKKLSSKISVFTADYVRRIQTQLTENDQR